MNGNVVYFPASENLNPTQALDSAKNIGLNEVVIIGYDENDELVVRSSKMCRKDALWLLQAAILYTMDI